MKKYEPVNKTNLGELYEGDSPEVLKQFPDNHFAPVITDPPYNLGFMGKAWDKTGVAFQAETWAEVLRVSKPGAILLAFGGSRTYHRMVCAIEDAGWEIRDCIQWLYGSGFPKSHNISKTIDIEACRALLWKALKREPTKEEFKSAWRAFRSLAWRDRYHDGKTRQELGSDHHKHVIKVGATANLNTVSVPMTQTAKLWDGYGTALKPAYEPIVLAMKPLDGTFVANAMKHGVAGLNIAVSRISTVDKLAGGAGGLLSNVRDNKEYPDNNHYMPSNRGRWPANVILSHHPDCEQEGVKTVRSDGHFPKSRPTGSHIGGQSGYAGQDNLEEKHIRNETVEKWNCHPHCPVKILDDQTVDPSGIIDAGGASRFFYCSKASKSERGRNNDHPTVKPIALIKYLIRLTAPPRDAHILDPFIGSGTLALACEELGIRYTGIDLDIAIAVDRVKKATEQMEVFKS